MNPYDSIKHLPKKRKGQSTMRELPPNTPIQVNLDTATKQACPCGNTYFTAAIAIYKVSALVSPTGQELIAQQPILLCTECKTPFGEKATIPDEAA
jgi:hypothetical protein